MPGRHAPWPCLSGSRTWPSWRDLPDLEFLSVEGTVDVTPVHGLARLRSLNLAGFRSSLDLQAFPHLEWFGVEECPPDGLDSLRSGHGTLRSLGVGRYPFDDLVPLGPMPLSALTLGGADLKGLDGIGSFGRTLRRLVIDGCPNLDSMQGISDAPNLEHLVLSDVRRITTLEWVRDLPALQFLNILEVRNVETLAPLAGHPSLQFVNFGKIRDLDLEPIARIPNLKLFNTGFYRWNRDLRTLPSFQFEPAESPLKQEWFERSLG